MQDHMCHLHVDFGQLNHLMCMVGRRRMKLPLPTWAGLGRDLDDLRGDQECLTMPGVPSLGTGLSVLARAAGPLLIRRIRRGRPVGVAGILGEASLECGDPPFLLLDDREQMDNHVAHDERGCVPNWRHPTEVLLAVG
jgi:hypothetical protein